MAKKAQVMTTMVQPPRPLQICSVCERAVAQGYRWQKQFYCDDCHALRISREARNNYPGRPMRALARGGEGASYLPD